MARTSGVIVAIVALTFVGPLPRGARADESNVQVCPASATTVPLDVSSPGATLKLKCSSSYTMQPEISSTTVENVYIDDTCNSPKPLNSVCPGANGTKSADVVTLVFPQLPTTATTMYLKCKGSNDCIFAVTVKEASPQGPQACAIKGSTVKLAVQGAAGKATFGCGSKLKLEHTDLKKALKEDCKTEEKLKDLTLTPVADNYYELAATKSPPTKTLCYLCGDSADKGQPKKDYCTVLISVSAGTRAAALSAFGLALPCFLTLLLFT